MPLRLYRCQTCLIEVKTFKKEPTCAHNGMDEPSVMTEVIVAPVTKFMEKIDQTKGKSRMVGQNKILKERAREHSRDEDMHDLIQMNDPDTAKKNKWLNETGVKRRKIDDI